MFEAASRSYRTTVRRWPLAGGCSAALFAAAGLVAGGCSAGGAASPSDLAAEDRAILIEIMREEDRRPAFADANAMRRGLASSNALIRRVAARGLGRLEEPAALAALGSTLADPDPSVRSTVAGAIAQSVFTAETGAAADPLRARLGDELDPAVRGALAQALGRLQSGSAAATNETQAILLGVAERDAPTETLVPALRGFEALVRNNRADIELTDDARARLATLTRYDRSDSGGSIEPTEGGPSDPNAILAAARVRRLALASLDAAGGANAGTVRTALHDPDVEVRRLAAIAVERIDDLDGQKSLLQVALNDDDGQVRYEALRVYGRRAQQSEGCAPIVEALQDEDPHVALQAIDLLAGGCDGIDTGSATTGIESLRTFAEELPGLVSIEETRGPDFDGVNPQGRAAGAADPTDQPVAWHAGAHALTTLAEVDPDTAARLVPAYALHPTWQVRMYGARAAAAVGAVDTLEQLARDAFPNVAEAALRGLDANVGDGADGAAVVALTSDDYQLLMTAANLLEGTAQSGALDALIATLERITFEQRETSRDPRRAILERIGELGNADRVDEILPYLEDFDPLIAAQAAEILLDWTGDSFSPSPQPLPLTPFPTIDELLELDGTRALIRMQGGGVIEIELHAFEAPTNVARFARQARSGYFEGLTFHRVVPNFVVQGGSPGANEYVGAGPYSRDEVGDRSHSRGTMGISTRGRDTGDSQIFINLVDNVRLDHNYTIIGTVASGMDVVDAALEGATIERITIEPRIDPE